ncbi:CMGC/SRPK protein kinase [Mycena polygramma]|nr:CMGC/SRPK protein kinase [Mycena polygramma]
MNFSNPHFERINTSYLVEEENLPDYVAARYYPVRIGELFASRYQVVGKLGYGVTSTAWLARDLKDCRHVALKIFTHSASLGPSNELAAYKRLERGPFFHPGRRSVRTLLDSFPISGPDGEHQCLVHSPLFESVGAFLARNPIGRLPIPILAGVLQNLFLALDYTRKCRIIHTDIGSHNLMFTIQDDTIFERFEQAELQDPTPRKEIDGRIIYLSRQLEMPNAGRIGLPVLCDFGSAVWGEQTHETDAQPDIYRSPEVLLDVPWSYEIDIWNVGCMIWDIFEGRSLFSGMDPERNARSRRAHLAEIIALLGPPPPSFVARGSLMSKFFSEEGEFLVSGIDVPPRVSLEQLETNLEGPEKKLFLAFVGKMLQWDPQKRQTAEQLLEDEWLLSRSVLK